MKSSKTYLVVILACTTLGTAALAWKQYQELIQLRAASLGADERADLQKRLWAAEKRAKDLADQLAALRNRSGGDEVAFVEGGDPADPENANRADRRNRGGPGGPGGRGGDFMAAMQKPEIQRLLATQQKAALDARYATLFKNLNLTPAQLDKFKNLLVEKQAAPMDVMAASNGQGLNREEMRKLVAGTQAEIDASIKASIGDTAYAQYKNFDQTAPQRSTTDQLSQRLSYSGAPLTADQSAAMLQILSQTAPQRTAATTGTATATIAVTADAGGGRGGMAFNIGGGGGSAASPITDATIAMAQGVLSAPQVEALKQLQQEQKAQQQIAQAFRQTMGGNNGATTTTPATTTKKKAGK